MSYLRSVASLQKTVAVKLDFLDVNACVPFHWQAHGHANAGALGMPMHPLGLMPVGNAMATGLPGRRGLQHFRVTPIGVPCLCGWLTLNMKPLTNSR